jgi:hypothetical protein
MYGAAGLGGVVRWREAGCRTMLERRRALIHEKDAAEVAAVQLLDKSAQLLKHDRERMPGGDHPEQLLLARDERGREWSLQNQRHALRTGVTRSLAAMVIRSAYESMTNS